MFRLTCFRSASCCSEFSRSLSILKLAVLDSEEDRLWWNDDGDDDVLRYASLFSPNTAAVLPNTCLLCMNFHTLFIETAIERKFVDFIVARLFSYICIICTIQSPCSTLICKVNQLDLYLYFVNKI